jgi:hypothetical protein
MGLSGTIPKRARPRAYIYSTSSEIFLVKCLELYSFSEFSVGWQISSLIFKLRPTLFILSTMSINEDSDQCARRADGTLKDSDEIVWYNDPDDTAPISAPGLGAPSLNLGLDGSTTAGQRVERRRVIKPTAKAQQSSLTGFLSTRTVVSEYPSVSVPPFFYICSVFSQRQGICACRHEQLEPKELKPQG